MVFFKECAPWTVPCAMAISVLQLPSHGAGTESQHTPAWLSLYCDILADKLTHDGRSSRAFLCGIICRLLFKRIGCEYLNFALSAFWLLLWTPWQFLLSTLIDGIDAPVKILMTRTNITTSKSTNYLPMRHLPTCDKILRQSMHT